MKYIFEIKRGALFYLNDTNTSKVMQRFSNVDVAEYKLLAESKLPDSEFDSLSNDDKFIYIMSSTHRPLVICLANYTYSCFQTLSVSRTSAL